MAEINESFGNYEQADLFYENIIKHHPLDTGYLSGYIRLKIKTGNIEEARDVFKRTKNIFKNTGNIDQYNCLAKQLNPERKLNFFYQYLKSLGVFEYRAGQLMVSDSKIVPLLTNSFLGWFETQNWDNKVLLELGSGSSTLYFAKHFKKIVSWETNKDWFSTLQEILPDNIEHHFVDSILKAFDSFDIHSFDAILLDCAENRAYIAKAISESGFKGVVFFDNSEWYRNGVNYLRKSGFREIPFFGLKPVEDWVSCTSVLFRDSSSEHILASNWKALPKFANYTPNNSWDMTLNH
jgi:tetratricopeptide (TPR) repeat protein